MKKITITLPDHADMCDAATLVGIFSQGVSDTEQTDFIDRMGSLGAVAEVDGELYVSHL